MQGDFGCEIFSAVVSLMLSLPGLLSPPWPSHDSGTGPAPGGTSLRLAEYAAKGRGKI